MNISMSVTIPGALQSLITGATIAVFGTLLGIPFSALQIILVMAVVVMAHLLTRLLFKSFVSTSGAASPK
jgi:hypothetical protein